MPPPAAGADAIKFQTHFPEHEMLRGGATAAYVGESLFDLLTRTALSREAHFELRDSREGKGIIFLSTPFSREAADFLETVGGAGVQDRIRRAHAFAASAHIARKGKPMIISTGMSTPEEIDRTVQTIRAEGRAVRADALHLDVPDALRARSARMHRRAEGTLRRAGRLLGSHARQLRGIRGGRRRRQLFEKHFTVSRSLPGPDQQGSMEPEELEELVRGIRAIEQARGATKKIQPGEQDVRNMALHSVVSIRDIAAGRDDRRRRCLGKAAGHRHSGATAGRGDRPRGEGAIARRLINWSNSVGPARASLSVLGVITARGGSKGIPGKNLKLLGARPLIAYTIDAARQSGAFDRLILSTDDPRSPRPRDRSDARCPSCGRPTCTR